MSRLKSLRRQARQLQARQIHGTVVFIVNDSEQIKDIKTKAKEVVYIVNNVDQNCIDCTNHFSVCDCETGNNGVITATMYEYWKENDPRHYERLMRLRDHDEQQEKTHGLDKWIENNVLYVRKKKINGDTESIDQIPLSKLSNDMKE
ncbi:hypothetical protein BK699_27775, partial [Bacillus thuringiensis serovar mexicanensis]